MSTVSPKLEYFLKIAFFPVFVALVYIFAHARLAWAKMCTNEAEIEAYYIGSLLPPI